MWQASRCQEFEGFGAGVLSRKSWSMWGVAKERRCREWVIPFIALRARRRRINQCLIDVLCPSS